LITDAVINPTGLLVVTVVCKVFIGVSVKSAINESGFIPMLRR